MDDWDGGGADKKLDKRFGGQIRTWWSNPYSVVIYVVYVDENVIIVIKCNFSYILFYGGEVRVGNSKETNHCKFLHNKMAVLKYY